MWRHVASDNAFQFNSGEEAVYDEFVLLFMHNATNILKLSITCHRLQDNKPIWEYYMVAYGRPPSRVYKYCLIYKADDQDNI